MPEKPPPDIQEQIKEAVRTLKAGGLVAFPTDTVYGLGARIDCAAAVEKVYAAKRRPRDMALPILLADISQIDAVARDIPEMARALAARFLPGALTLVLHKSRKVPDIVTAGGDTVAVRVPAHPVALALIRGVGVPITGTSANRSGRPVPTTAAGVREQLGGEIDLIIQGGESPGGRESTIVDVTGGRAIVLREGAISIRELRRVCAAAPRP